MRWASSKRSSHAYDLRLWLTLNSVHSWNWKKISPAMEECETSRLHQSFASLSVLLLKKTAGHIFKDWSLPTGHMYTKLCFYQKKKLMSGGLLIINNTEQGTSIALWLYKHSMCLFRAFCCFRCRLLHNRLYETAERAHTQADMHTLPSHEPHRLPGSLRSSHSAK